MNNNISRCGFPPDGCPVNYRDEDGVIWIYQGKTRFDFDHWCGIPPEDQF